MEQFEAIAVHQPVFPGDLISKRMTLILTRAGLVRRDRDGNVMLTMDGVVVWERWRRVHQVGKPV
jgi:hypothetical protein